MSFGLRSLATCGILTPMLMIGIKRFGGTLYHYDEPFNSILENSGLKPKEG